MESKLPVVIIQDGGDYSSVAGSLSDPYFDILNSQITISSSSPLEYEKQLVLSSLRECKHAHPDSPCLLIKDTSNTVFNPEQIAKFASYKFKSDLLYLCTWNDSCNLYKDVEPASGPDNPAVITYKPYGFQAIIFSVKARDYILSKEFKYKNFIGFVLPTLIYSNKLTAETYINNIYNYNTLVYASNDDDYNKLNRCSDVVPERAKGIPPSTYFYVSAIIALLIVAVVGIFRSGFKSSQDPKLASDKKDKPQTQLITKFDLRYI